MHCTAGHQGVGPQVATTLVDLLRVHASTIGDKQAFCFVQGQDRDDVSVTYHALDQRAMAIGGQLQALMAPGDRALLLFPPGLDFITAFFGCLYAGVAAVPVALPPRNRPMSSVEAILKASNPAVILSTADHCELARQSYSRMPALLERPWLATDAVADDRRDAWRDPHVDGRHTAFLQYTSGSTSSPKGVILTHANLLHNAAAIQGAFGNTPEGRGVSWLPLYHDMGLIGGVVQPIYCGALCTLLAPVAFLQRPALWLETIARTRATVSGGPNFGYDLCVRKVPPEERRRLDLSSWEVAFTGAERVRADTIERFTEAFAPCGFRREAFFPCYGLAEATLLVSGGPRQTAPAIVRVRADALARNQVQKAGDDGASRTFVGCGECLPGQTIAIVDPRTCLRCPEGEVGEIWVQGDSVAGGYFGQPAMTEASFGARLGDTREGPFLRTGDLGFLRGGQLFVTGRIKDVIIIRGRNYYPEDIENSVDGAHPALRAGYCAAFSIDRDDRERLVVVQEIDPRRRDLDADAVLRAIRGAIAAQHELEIYAVVLAKAGEVPKTSSGKTQRSACRERYLNGMMEIIAEWKANLEASEGEIAAVQSPAGRQDAATAAEIEDWLIQRIARRLGLAPRQIGVATPFIEFGMGSLDALEIAGELERRLGRAVSPTTIYNYPNIAALARWLANPPPDGESPAEIHRAQPARGGQPPERLSDDVRNMTEEEIKAFIEREMARQRAGTPTT
ncbi:MAG: AMP-binding protein [Thermoguttaceae bacterium]